MKKYIEKIEKLVKKRMAEDKPKKDKVEQKGFMARKEKPEIRRTLPLGLEHDLVLASIIKVAQSLNVNPDCIWTVGSSGTLNRGLQIAFPKAECHLIQTGHKLSDRQVGRAKLYVSKYKFDQAVKENEAPPFPSAPEYDAKAWKFIKEHADNNKKNLFWNVAS